MAARIPGVWRAGTQSMTLPTVWHIHQSGVFCDKDGVRQGFPESDEITITRIQDSEKPAGQARYRHDCLTRTALTQKTLLSARKPRIPYPWYHGHL